MQSLSEGQCVSRGPALRDVSPTDDDAVRAIVAEQRAMLEVVRGNRVWDWLGGMPSGFGNPKAGLYGIYLAVGFVALMAIALVVAGFDRGVWLGAFVGLALLCLVVRSLVEGSAERRTKAFFARAVQMPAVVLHSEEPDFDGDDEDPPTPVALLVGTNVQSAVDLQELLAVGGRLRAGIRDLDACEPALRDLAASIRAGQDCDGSRRALPDAVGAAMELSCVPVAEDWLPERELDSQLVFVLADPGERGARHTRVAHHAAWGPGAVGLCASLPLEDDA